MRNRVLVAGIGRGGKIGRQQVRQAFGAFLRPVHADERLDRGAEASGRVADRRPMSWV